jgi:hypothetical protein
MDASVLSRLETENATLLSRYQTWLHISDAENKSIGLTPENSVPTEHLSGAHRLMILRAFDDAAKGQVAAASQRLYRMISDLRRHLALADDFAAKLILADLMDESLQAVSVISHTHRIKLPPLRPLTPEEKDLSPAIARQFRKAYDFFLSVDAMRSRGDDGPPDSATQRSRMQRFIYKPNHAINRTHQVMSFWMEAARGTPSEFARLMSQQASRNQALILWDHLRNPLGRTLSQLAEPNFKTQIVRLQRLDIMIAMFNATQEHALEDIPPEALASPYGLGGLAAPSPNRSALCMPSPDIIDANPTCLHLGR